MSDFSCQLKKEGQARCQEIELSVQKLISAGGKRLRPLLILLAARFGENESVNKEKLIKIAVGVELLHMATLVHDDIIDGATLRRGTEAVCTQLGNKKALLVGDFLLHRAHAQLSGRLSERTEEKLHLLEQNLCMAEIKQLSNRNRLNISCRDYLARVRRKTALFFAFCTYTGGYESGVRTRKLSYLYNLGLKMGMAFQIRDDLLDFISENHRRGKDTGLDLANGEITLPIILLLKTEKYGPEVKQIINREEEKKNIGKSDCQRLRKFLQQSGCQLIMENFIDDYLSRARENLHNLPCLPVRSELAKLINRLSLK